MGGLPSSLMDLAPSFASLAIVIPLIILIAVWILLLMIQPIFVVIDCIISKLTLTRKIIWLAVMFFSLGLATTFYPYMVSESRFLRWITILSYFPLILLLIIYIFMYLQYPEVRELMTYYFDFIHSWFAGDKA
jgi:hypothetical protein